MQERQDQRQQSGANDEGTITSQQATERLQQAMRREAATRDDNPDPSDQVSDSANQGGMGSSPAGSARTRRA